MSQTIQCPGFKAAGISAGIKKHQALDLGLIYSRKPAVAVGVFTRNQVQAAPVRLTRDHISSGQAHAVIVNSGNANCCNGDQGDRDALQMARLTAAEMDLSLNDVLVSSTGVIGQSLPMDKIEKAIPALTQKMRPEGFEDFARAIMTTDTVPKLIQRHGEIDGRPFTILAAAKGAGMIRPDMATMLCFVCTDAEVQHRILKRCLQRAVDNTLNCMTIDGDTSTNDMVLMMANAQSGAKVALDDQVQVFQHLLDDLLADTARRLVQDGEGVTKVVDICVQGAGSDEDARLVADTVAHSPLVKTAFFGEDANWGRIIAAAGRAGVAFDMDRIDLYFEGVQMVKGGCGCGPDAEAKATAILEKPEFRVVVDLNQGPGKAHVITGDLSVDYVKINADYRT